MRPFALVLAGGGARGYAHVGVLRALDAWGLVPSGIVGVSMGAVVAATYAVRDDWYDVLLSVSAGERLGPVVRVGAARDGTVVPHSMLSRARSAWNMLTGWGAPAEVARAARETMDALLGSARLEDGRIPVVLCSTDLVTGTRIEHASGPAAVAAYASSALAGIFPPLELDDRLLVDGVYTDIAPIDVARRMGAPIVVVVDPSQPVEVGSIRNGLQCVTRAMEICHTSHAHLRVEEADLVLRPRFGRFVDVLDFGARRVCIAAGLRAARHGRTALETLLRR